MKKQTPPITITEPTTIPMMLDWPMLPPPPPAVVVVGLVAWVCVAVVGVGTPGAVTPPESGPPFEPAATATLVPSSSAHRNASANGTADDLRGSLGTGGLSVN
jgi:hypothetical protein